MAFANLSRLAANISWLFTEEESLVQRICDAAGAGFEAIECLFPYEVAASRFRRALETFGMNCVLINAPAGEWARGDRGLAAVVGRESEFRSGVHAAIEYARRVGCPRIHVMSGLAVRTDHSALRTACVNLAFAAEAAEAAGVVIVIEAINHVDMPGYFVRTVDDAMKLVTAIGHPALRLQLDLYHHVMERGDAVAAIRAYAAWIEHIQIAGVPGRHEPDRGELQLTSILTALEQIEFRGWIGCEYAPFAGTVEGLQWIERLRTTDG